MPVEAVLASMESMESGKTPPPVDPSAEPLSLRIVFEDLRPASATPEHPAPAPMSRRVFATLLDFICSTGVGIAVTVWRGEQVEPGRWAFNGLPGCAFILLIASYWVLPEWIFGATLGKALFGVRVVSLFGPEPSFIQVVKRNILKSLGAATFYSVDFVVALSDPLRRSMGDRWAKTMVVSKDDAGTWKPVGSHEEFERWLRSFKELPPEDPLRPKQG
jgi:uncharacterized RDD family membrane protein YckC